jgi:hypothetical protein
MEDERPLSDLHTYLLAEDIAWSKTAMCAQVDWPDVTEAEWVTLGTERRPAFLGTHLLIHDGSAGCFVPERVYRDTADEDYECSCDGSEAEM